MIRNPRTARKPNRLRTRIAQLAFLFAFAGATPATAATITALGSINSNGYGINGAGQVVGSSQPAFGIAQQAFLYSGGVITDLGTLGGSSSSAYGINASGQVVGSAYTAGNAATNAFLYLNSSGVMTDLGTLGGPDSYAYGINNSGQIVGDADTTVLIPGNGNQHYSHAFLYSGGSMTDLGTLGGPESAALGINASGQVVGFAYTASFQEYAFLYSGGVMTDLGTIGGFSSVSGAAGINDSGQIVGVYTTDNNMYDQAFLYSSGIMTGLGTLGGSDSEAYGINDSGQVVGTSTTPGDATFDAFLYSGGTMIDLNSLLPPGSNWQLTSARAINDSGQIVGTGLYCGEELAFVLDTDAPSSGPAGSCPVAPTPTPTPEPTSMALLGGGLAILVLFRTKCDLREEFPAKAI